MSDDNHIKTNPRSLSFLSLVTCWQETMRQRPHSTAFLASFLTLLVLAAFSLHLSRNAITVNDIRWYPESLSLNVYNDNSRKVDSDPVVNVKHVIRDGVNEFSRKARHVSSVKDSISTVSILIPDWEILIIVSHDTLVTPDPGEEYQCLFSNKAKSPAKFSGVLPFTNRTTFKCALPESARRGRKIWQPVLTKASDDESPSPTPELLRWNFVVYESYSTEDDVVLLAKGVNRRQGMNWSPEELRCVFDYGNNNAVRTAVTSSIQEVFRCQHPNITEPGPDINERIKVSLDILSENTVVPSVAYYIPRSNIPSPEPKNLLCACTMVYNVAKFLREWVMYHSRIGVQKFILYDNGSDDDLESVVGELNTEGYNVSTLFWIWPKTQEAGFSHSTVFSKNSCTWMMFVDVDEFVYSRSWLETEQPSNHMLQSILPRAPHVSLQRQRRIGQVSMRCNEFGPSGQTSHPVEGVTQGYTCRKKVEQRHKSILLLDAVDHSLVNVIHHFMLREGFASKQASGNEFVVNHYKYQAWSEFKTKFRRRVSAYVVDWKEAVNLKSKDRTPGLGYQAVEPEGWAQKFCEVRDLRLESLTRRWFGSSTPNGSIIMAWQS